MNAFSIENAKKHMKEVGWECTYDSFERINELNEKYKRDLKHFLSTKKELNELSRYAEKYGEEDGDDLCYIMESLELLADDCCLFPRYFDFSDYFYDSVKEVGLKETVSELSEMILPLIKPSKESYYVRSLKFKNEDGTILYFNGLNKTVSESYEIYWDFGDHKKTYRNTHSYEYFIAVNEVISALWWN